MAQEIMFQLISPLYFAHPLLAFVSAHLPSVLLCSLLVIFIAAMHHKNRRPRVFMVDFACYKPDDALKCPHSIFLERSALLGVFSEQSMKFQKTILDKSAIGEKTYFPPALWMLPPNPCMAEGRKEMETVMFGAIDEVLKKTGVKPSDIGIVIANCSVFSPTPSLVGMIVNHYKLRNNILSYSLGGMGCSAGVISLDLAKKLLQVHPNTYALVVSTENITLNWYLGNNRSKLVSNCLFRMGAGAVLLSNKMSDRHRAKYELLHTLRTHYGAEERGYRSAYQEEDDAGIVGVTLSRDLSTTAGDALRTNISNLGPLVLPPSEQLFFLANLIARKVFKMKIKSYMPDFKRAFEHFCIHAGGRGVLDSVEKNLHLTDWQMEPSRMTLYRFGNTSSSSLWYELAYSEAKGRVRKGHRVWQIALGSGFKCNSAVWRALRTVDPNKEKNAWSDEIDQFPVVVPKLVSSHS
ncbi:PREDICTED: 3-ketoacyl-CoA synthase 11-like [Nelumbo nucifera]|uniref:3-ketoacyl-CoA synthase n=1 Tax=Nelumbo nucifera TaxID=4432 RepID=A0A1U8BD56_NELNU|nr:PREDICTED: 3-ketoacyl-CoA synthase 11-like [Nelumbo nucifera]